MTPAPRPADPLDENELLAAEYVLGVLDAADRARVQNMAKTSPAFAQRIAAWEARLAPLADDIAPVPAPNLLPQIEGRLFGAASPKPRWWSGLLGIGLTAAASVALLAVFLQIAPLIFTPDAQLQTTTLAAEGSDLTYMVQRVQGQIILTRTAGPAPATGRSYELWVIDGDAPPVSLGLVDAILAIPEPQAAAGYVLAITDEPQGGGPNGVATGAVLALGAFSEN